MGTRGPIPKAEDQRRRRNKTDKNGLSLAVQKIPSGAEKQGPDLNFEVHPLARDWYESLRVSAQSALYEPSDWAQARVWTEVLSRALQTAPPRASLFATWLAGETELLTTEGARRRMRIELTPRGGADTDDEAADAAMDKYAARFRSARPVS